MIQYTEFIHIHFLFLFLVTAGIVDLRTQKIPNVLTLPSAIFAVTYHSILNGVEGFLFSTGGLLTGAGLLLIPYLLGGMGAGDAKMLGAVGGVLGAKSVFYAFLCSSIVGGVYALVLTLIYRRQFKGFFKKMATSLLNFILIRKYIQDPMQPESQKPKLCYGIAIAIGTSFYILSNFSKYNLLS